LSADSHASSNQKGEIPNEFHDNLPGRGGHLRLAQRNVCVYFYFCVGTLRRAIRALFRVASH
jgi:hypothetical protein